MFLFVLSRQEACLLLAVASSRVPVADLLSGGLSSEVCLCSRIASFFSFL